MTLVLRIEAPPAAGGITSLGQFQVQRRDRAGDVIHEYRLMA
jgi:hypothetical protein